MELSKVQWLNLKSTKGRANTGLKDFELLVYKRQLEKANQGNYITFSQLFLKKYEGYKVQVGLMNKTLLLNFNKTTGIDLKVNIGNKGTCKRLRLSNKDLVSLIHENCGLNIERNSNEYILNDIGNDTYAISRKLNL
jgi:hypothetical protein